MAAKLKACEPVDGAADDTRLEGRLPYTYSGFLHNLGGDYLGKDRKPALCSKEAQAATTLYAKMLKDYGPPGAINNNFYQNTSLYRRGQGGNGLRGEQRTAPRDGRRRTAEGHRRRAAAR